MWQNQLAGTFLKRNNALLIKKKKKACIVLEQNLIDRCVLDENRNKH